MPFVTIYLILSTSIFLFFLVWGASRIDSQFFLYSYCSNKSKSSQVSITFDDGPDFNNTPEILNILREYDAKATFFIIGSKIENNHELVKRINIEGHLLANHSYSHQNNFPFLSLSRMQKEIIDCNKLINNIKGGENRYFRPPFGVTNPTLAKALKKLNIVSIGWSIRSLDTLNEESEIVLQRVIKQLKEGDIILLHDTSKNILVILRELLEFLKIKNIKSVTIEELLFS